MEKQLFVSMRHISKTFSGVQALNDVNFDLEKGKVHCLIGENGSGKSTLIKILCGVEKPNPGSEIFIRGASHKDLTRSAAMAQGINVIYQDLSLFENLSVAENICFNLHVEGRTPFVRKKEMRRIAQEKIALIGQDLDPDAIVETLSIADRQLVAICRALVGELSLLIMDEPTSSLTAKEVKNMFRVVQMLLDSGVTIMFVSHKLEEVIEIADCVTVLKDGRIVGSLEGEDITRDHIVELMWEKRIALTKLRQPVKSQRVVLQVEGLTKAGEFEDITFSAREGEVVGMIGLLGSGRTELARALIGYRPADRGTIRIDGVLAQPKCMRDGIKLGMGMVSEDRLHEGLIMVQSVAANLAVTTLEEQLTPLGLLDPKKSGALVERLIREIGIRVSSAGANVGTLSGGNQQKVVIGKWLATNPKILILDGPTIGIDIAARNSIYDIIKDLAKQGMTVVVISDETLEVMENTHRIFVMHKGRLVDEFVTADVTEQALLNSINGGEETCV